MRRKATEEIVADFLISPSDPMVVIAGIKQFGLASDRSDLQDLAHAFSRMKVALAKSEEERRQLALALAGLLNLNSPHTRAAAAAALRLRTTR